jgi:O-acetylhomoserine/O-acetylserine sulfhydrylase-like pyridoxal-dependent enzyme
MQRDCRPQRRRVRSFCSLYQNDIIELLNKILKIIFLVVNFVEGTAMMKNNLVIDDETHGVFVEICCVPLVVTNPLSRVRLILDKKLGVISREKVGKG